MVYDKSLEFAFELHLPTVYIMRVACGTARNVSNFRLSSPLTPSFPYQYWPCYFFKHCTLYFGSFCNSDQHDFFIAQHPSPPTSHLFFRLPRFPHCIFFSRNFLTEIVTDQNIWKTLLSHWVWTLDILRSAIREWLYIGLEQCIWDYALYNQKQSQQYISYFHPYG